MNAVEKLQAAIDKLETLKAKSMPGPWEWTGDFLADDVTLRAAGGAWVINAYGEHSQGFLEVTPTDADLIVTLHRTIDAQLAILREVVVASKIERHWETLVYTETALALADAILGEEQGS